MAAHSSERRFRPDTRLKEAVNELAADASNSLGCTRVKVTDVVNASTHKPIVGWRNREVGLSSVLVKARAPNLSETLASFRVALDTGVALAAAAKADAAIAKADAAAANSKADKAEADVAAAKADAVVAKADVVVAKADAAAAKADAAVAKADVVVAKADAAAANNKADKAEANAVAANNKADKAEALATAALVVRMTNIAAQVLRHFAGFAEHEVKKDRVYPGLAVDKPWVMTVAGALSIAPSELALRWSNVIRKRNAMIHPPVKGELEEEVRALEPLLPLMEASCPEEVLVLRSYDIIMRSMEQHGRR